LVGKVPVILFRSLNMYMGTFYVRLVTLFWLIMMEYKNC
jgi:hypothetical protein